MPQYFTVGSIQKAYGLPIKEIVKIIKSYKDVIKPSPISTDTIVFYSIHDAELVNEIYFKMRMGKGDKQIREELKLPKPKERKTNIVSNPPPIEQGQRVETDTVKKAKPENPQSKRENKNVNAILADLYKARLQEYYDKGFITKTQMDEMIGYEQLKLK